MLIAGKIPLRSVMNRLAEDRAVLHSEGDLQHAFGRAIWEIDPQVQVRAEIRQQGIAPVRQVLDMSCSTSSGRTAIEFKFHPGSGRGKDRWGDEFVHRQQGADDVLRHGFVKDISRLESFCKDPRWSNGLALLVSNVPALWNEPTRASHERQDRDFRLHEGTTLQKTLSWAGQQEHSNALTLQGSYELRWRDYAPPVEGIGQFRYLAVEVAGVRDQKS